VALEIEPLTADQKLLDLELKEIAQSLDENKIWKSSRLHHEFLSR